MSCSLHLCRDYALSGDQVREAYTQSVLESGVVPGVRGCAIAVPKATSVGGSEEVAYWLLGHATLAEAVYEAHDRHPMNEQVKQTISQGLSGALVLSVRTPRDVMVWLVSEHNKYHQGSSMTVLEYLQRSTEAQAGWQNHCNEHEIRVRNLPTSGPNSYQKKYEAFVLQNWPIFSKWQHYQDAVALSNNLQSRGLFEPLKALLEQRGDFLNQRINNVAVVSNFHKIVLTLKERCC
eukprot:2868950-Amphidinium_carterae.2